LPGDDARPVREGADVGVDEGLVVEADLAAAAVAGVVTGESRELVDQAVRLRSVVIGENGDVFAEDHGAGGRFVASGDVRVDAGYGHGLRAAGDLPEDFVAASQRVAGLRWGREIQGIGEFDAINDLVGEARALSDVEFVAIAIARAQPLIAL